jgi:hypothetical protein
MTRAREPRRTVATTKPLADDPIDLAHASWVGQGWEEAADGMAVGTSIMRVQQVLLARFQINCINAHQP